MKRTTKSIFALIMVLVMCVSFCVPTFAEVAAVADDANTNVANCPLAGKTHTLEALAAGGHIDVKKDENGTVVLVDGKDVVAVYKVVNPNCEDRGYTIYECLACAKDGKDLKFVDSWVESDSRKHDWDITEVITPATCDKDGVGKGKCKNCDVSSDDIAIPKTGHKFGTPIYIDEDKNIVPNYTCGMPGVTKVEICSVCGYEQSIKIENDKHDWKIYFTLPEGFVIPDDVNVEGVEIPEGKTIEDLICKPTCVTDGLAYYVCDNCNVHDIKSVPKLDKNDPIAHVWEGDYKAPTCAVDDPKTEDVVEGIGWYKNATCKLCGETAEYVEIDRLDHPADKWVDATCAKAKHCGVCGYEDGVALDHNFKAVKDEKFVAAPNMVNVVILETASCKDEFWYCADVTCPNLGESKSAGNCDKCEKPLTYNDGGIGHVIFDCTLCGETKIEKELPRSTHQYEKTSKAPTCPFDPNNTEAGVAEWGFEAEVCIICGDNENFYTIPPYSHDPSFGNCKDNWGDKDENGKFTEDSLEAVENGHVDPTCDAPGYSKYFCKVCQTEIVIDLDQLEHVWKEIEVAATCDFPAHKITKCQRDNCTAVKFDVPDKQLDAAGRYDIGTEKDPDNHAKVTTEWTTLPTCTKVGYEKTFCQACNWVEVDEAGNEVWREVAKLDHDATKWNEYWTRYNEYYKNIDDEKYDPDKGDELGGHWISEVSAPTCVDNAVWLWACDLCNTAATPMERTGTDKNVCYDATGHTFYEYVDVVDANGKVTGQKLVILGKFFKVYDPTCLAPGYTEITCRDCSVKNTDDRAFDKDDDEKTVWDSSDELLTYVDDDLEHEYVKVEGEEGYQPPQCNGDGTYEYAQWKYVCEDCGAVDWVDDKSVVFDVKDVTHHSNPIRDDDGYHRDPTCTINGIESYECTTCGRTCSKTLYATDHDKGTTPVIKPAKERTNCLEGGSPEYYVCVKCGEDVINYPADCDTPEKKAAYEAQFAKLLHTWKDATCVDPKKCELCGFVANGTDKDAADFAVGPLDHDWIAATCTEDKHCSRCDAKVANTKFNHMKDGVSAIIAPVTVPVTCVSDGYTYKYCALCNANWEIYNYVYALGHEFKNLVSHKAPTCTKDGEDVFDCTRCDVTNTVTLDKLAEDGKGHTKLDAEGKVLYRFDDKCVDANGVPYPDYDCDTENCPYDKDSDDMEHRYNLKENGERLPYEVGGDCTQKNYALYLCLDCKAHELDEDLDDDGVKDEPHKYHSWIDPVTGKELDKDWVIVKEAKIGEIGQRYRACSCKFCEVTGPIEDYTVGAGVQFDFKITNLVGAVEEDGYAGRIKLVVDLAVQDVFANNAILNIKFNNDYLKFVGGNLLSTDFTYYDSFTDADAANAKGYVVVTAASDKDVKLTGGAFAELFFDVRVDTYANIGEDVEFTIITKDKDPGDGSAPTAVTNKENKEFTVVGADKTKASAKITRFADLTLANEDDKVDGLDASALLELIKLKFDGKSDYKYRSEADLNRDGNIDVNDYIIMATLNNGSVSYSELDEVAVDLDDMVVA